MLKRLYYLTAVLIVLYTIVGSIILIDYKGVQDELLASGNRCRILHHRATVACSLPWLCLHPCCCSQDKE
jgi:hypothetical protein